MTGALDPTTAAGSHPETVNGLVAIARRHPRVTSAVVAVGSGLVTTAAFPPLGWWPCAVLGAAGLTAAVRGHRLRVAFVLGLLAGLAFFVPLLGWLRVVGIDAWLLLSLAESLFVALLGVGLAVVVRLPAWPLWAACLWVTQEWARDRVPFGGFPWGRLAFSQDGAPMVRLAALGGAPLVTFAVALAASLLLAAWWGRGAVRRAGLVAGAVGVTVVGLAVPVGSAGQSDRGPAHATVAVVQGNVPRLGLEEFAQARAVIRRHADATIRLAADVAAGRVRRPDLVVWPENSSDFDPYTDAEAGRLITEAVRAIGVPVLVGAILDGPGPNQARNTGIVWDPATGPGDTYVKRHPVPFGEYVPFRGLLSRLVGRFSMVPADFVAGNRAGVLELGPARVGDVICFEIAYDEVVRDAVTGGGRLIVVQTNNATFERVGENGRGGETAQQLAMSRLRAIEHGRSVLVAATSGVSAVIRPDGAVVRRSGVFTQEVLVTDVPLRDAHTVADRVGAAPEWLLALAGLAAVVAGVLRGRRRTNQAPQEPPPLPSAADPADVAATRSTHA